MTTQKNTGLNEVGELLDLVSKLTEQLAVEIELHYQDHEIAEIGDRDTVMLMVDAAKVLHRHGVRPPSIVGNLLWTVTIHEKG